MSFFFFLPKNTLKSKVLKFMQAIRRKKTIDMARMCALQQSVCARARAFVYSISAFSAVALCIRIRNICGVRARFSDMLQNA